MLLARSVSAEGKGSARIGGQLATASTLSALGAVLVEVHGQHQAQRLLDPATQTAFLDRFAGDAHLVALGPRTARPTTSLRAVTAELDRLREASRDRERELDLLAYQVREIEAVLPEPGESGAPRGRGGASGPRRAAARARGVAEAGTRRRRRRRRRALGVAAKALSDVADARPRGRRARRARGAALAAEAAELARDVRAYRESLAADPERLQQVRERLGALRALQRKYGETDADVLRVHAARRRPGSPSSRAPTTASPSSATAGGELGRGGRRARRAWSPPVAPRAAGPLGRGDRIGARRARHAGGRRRGGARAARRRRARPGRSGCSCASRAAPRLTPMPLAEHGVGRRALAHDARLPQRAGRPRRRADPGLRRGRCRHRGQGRAGGGYAARQARPRPAGARRDAPAPDRLLRRSARPGVEAGRHGDGRGARRRAARARSSPACWQDSTSSASAVSHAEELLAEAATLKAAPPAGGRPSGES